MQKHNQIYDLFLRPEKRVILLIDPDKFDEEKTSLFFSHHSGLMDMIFVGGSLLSANRTSFVIAALKKLTQIPVVLFPGNSMQLSANADAILFLSLISGRNAEYLIGQHVQAAPLIYNSELEVIPTSYMLIDGGNRTSVQYISQSMPIPADKTDIAVATALAGKFLGHKLIYLEAGSGALNAVPADIVKAVSSKTNLPVVVGGGIRDEETAMDLFSAGANSIVIGSLFETNPDAVLRIAQQIRNH
ncbi:Geranylgeranylglyceryl phosphate synthase [anaerobic digester metagenome]